MIIRLLLIILLTPLGALAEPNFSIPERPDLESKAEQFKDELSQLYFGQTYPDYPTSLRIDLLRRGGGVTTFISGKPISCRVGIPYESTLKHEVCHIVLHYYLGDNIPRWLDEGLCVLVEDSTEQAQLLKYLDDGFIYSKADLESFENYPRHTLNFYAQSYILCAYLVRKYGDRGLLEAYAKGELEWTDQEYQDWYRAGCPEPESVGNCTFNNGQWNCGPGILPRNRDLPPPQTSPPRQTPNPGQDSQVKENSEAIKQIIESIKILQQTVRENAELLGTDISTLQEDIKKVNEQQITIVEETQRQRSIISGILDRLGGKVKDKVVDDGISKIILWLAGILGVSTPVSIGIVAGYKLIKLRLKRKSPVEQGDAFLPRDTSEAKELVDLGRREGRDPIHDAFVGMSLDDFLREDSQSHNPAKREWAESLISRIRSRVNRVLPHPKR